MRYFKILKIILKNAYIRDSKILGSVTSEILISFVEIIISLTILLTIFQNTESLAGWNYWQVLFLFFLMKVLMLISGLFFRAGLSTMAKELVRRGDYDFYLTKPVNSLILVSISKPRIYNLIILPFLIFMMIYSAINSGIEIHFINSFWFLILIIFSSLLIYFINVITVTPAFWFVKLFSLSDVMNRLSQFMRYPAGIYSLVVRVVFYTLLPVLAVTYLPAYILFYQPKPAYIIYMIAITAIFGFLAVKFWKIGEKHYGSASS